MTPAKDKSTRLRVGLIQMRSGREPSANLDAAVTLIGEAKKAGAAYVQTPEMTNILESSREALFAKIVAEEDDPCLAALRNLLHLFVGRDFPFDCDCVGRHPASVERVRRKPRPQHDAVGQWVA